MIKPLKIKNLPIVTVHKNVRKVTAEQTVIANAKTAFILASIPFILKYIEVTSRLWNVRSVI